MKTAIFAVVATVLSSCVVYADEPLWGPVTVTRQIGKPVTETFDATVPDSSWQYTLRVSLEHDGLGLSDEETGKYGLGSAWIWVNDKIVVDPPEFNSRVADIRKPLILKHSNTLKVQLAGKPGSRVQVAIQGPSREVVLPTEGGLVTLPGISVAFPPGSFSGEQLVRLHVSNDHETREIFDTSTTVFEAGPSLAFDLRIATGSALVTKEVMVKIVIPEWFAEMVERSYEIQAFYQLEEDGGLDQLDNFDILDSEYNSNTRVLAFSLPPWGFSKHRTPDGTYEAILIVGTTPAYWLQRNEALSKNSETEGSCDGLDAGSPLPGNLDIVSAWGDPREGGTATHKGVDYRATVGTAVRAIADGKITDAQVNAGKWGNILLVTHTVMLPDGSNIVYSSLYAHLQEAEVEAIRRQIQTSGSIPVTKGDPLGVKTGISGNAVGTTPHLHLELIRNCRYYPTTRRCNPSKVNPAACITPEAESPFDIVSTWPAFGSAIWAGDPAYIACDIQYTAESGMTSPAGVVKFYFDQDLFVEVPFEPLEKGTVRRIAAPTRFTPQSPFDASKANPFQDGDATYEIQIVAEGTKNASGTVIIKYNPYQVFGQMGTSWTIEYTHELHEFDPGYGITRNRYSQGSGFTRRVDVYSQNETLIHESGGWNTVGGYDNCEGTFDHKLDDDCIRIYNTGTRDGDYTFNIDHRWTSCPQFRHPDYPGCWFQNGSCEKGSDPSIGCNRFDFELPFRANKLGKLQMNPTTQAEVTITADGLPQVEITQKIDVERADGGYQHLLTHVVSTRVPIPGVESAQAEKPMVASTLKPSLFLGQNSPNPFYGATDIAIELPLPTKVEIDVFDIAGRRVRTLVANELLGRGIHHIVWNGRDDSGISVSSGIYFYYLKSDYHSEAKRMVLVR